MSNACLNLRSEFSLEQGLHSIGALLDRAREHRLTAVGLVDRATLLGAEAFVAGARRRGLSPVVGVEFELAALADPTPPTLESLTRPTTFPIVLFARNAEGRRRLARLVTLAQARAGEGSPDRPADATPLHPHGRRPAGRPFLLFDDLIAHHHGLIAQSPGLHGEVSSRIQRGQADLAERLALRFVEVFGRSSVFLGLSLHGRPEEARLAAALAELAERIGVDVVASDVVDHLDEDDRPARDARLRLAGVVGSDDALGADTRFRTPGERRRLYQAHPEALDTADRLAELCREGAGVADVAPTPPVVDYPLPAGRSESAYLASLCEAKRPRGRAYETRLEEELLAIAELGLSGWFLVQWDLVRYARAHGKIVTPLDGSIRASLAAWLLGLTEFDPVALGLEFAHFRHDAERGVPPIRIGVAAEHRAELAAYLRHRYGSDAVAFAPRVERLTPRRAIERVGTALHFEAAEVEAAARQVSEHRTADVAEAVARNVELARRYRNEPRVRAWLDRARRLSGLPVAVAADPNRVVLAGPDTFARPVPDRDGRDYFEIDVREVRVTVLEFTAPRPAHSDLPFRPDRRFDDRVVEASLDYVARRAPGVAERFRRRASGREPARCVDSRLEPILARTYGLLLEEEQLADMARVLAGFGPDEAEAFRRALVPVDRAARPSESASSSRIFEVRRHRLDFVDGAVRLGLEPAEAESLFLSMLRAAPRLAARTDSAARARHHLVHSRTAPSVREAPRRPAGLVAAPQFALPWAPSDRPEGAVERHTGTYGAR
jgi:DNA polymerase-3 subunit alpha